MNKHPTHSCAPILKAALDHRKKTYFMCSMWHQKARAEEKLTLLGSRPGAWDKGYFSCTPTNACK